MAKKSKKKRSLAIPFHGEWEVWDLSSGANPTFVQSVGNVEDLNLPQGSIFGLPSQQVFSLPLRLTTSDTEFFGEMVELQLEKHHLINEATVSDYEIIAKSDESSWISCSVISEEIPDEMAFPSCQQYDWAGRFYYYPENQFVIWQELDRLSLVVTRGNVPFYFQTLTNAASEGEIAKELFCIYGKLASEGFIDYHPRLTIWSKDAIKQPFHQNLESMLNWPLIVAERPAPSLPSKKWNLMPDAVRVKRQQMKQRTQQYKLLGAVLGVYVLVVLGFIGFLVYQVSQLQAEEKKLAKEAPVIRKLQQAELDWASLDVITDDSLNSLELLRAATNALPPQGVNFSEFNMENYQIFIKGSASNASAASSYSARLKSDPVFANYSWQHQEPVITPSGVATYTIIGKHNNAPTEE